MNIPENLSENLFIIGATIVLALLIFNVRSCAEKERFAIEGYTQVVMENKVIWVKLPESKETSETSEKLEAIKNIAQ
jgi:hypothetical protein